MIKAYSNAFFFYLILEEKKEACYIRVGHDSVMTDLDISYRLIIFKLESEVKANEPNRCEWRYSFQIRPFS